MLTEIVAAWITQDGHLAMLDGHRNLVTITGGLDKIMDALNDPPTEAEHVKQAPGIAV